MENAKPGDVNKAKKNRVYKRLQRVRRRILYGQGKHNVPVQWPMALSTIILPGRREFHQRFPHPLAGRKGLSKDYPWLDLRNNESPWSWSMTELPESSTYTSWPFSTRKHVFSLLTKFAIECAFRPMIIQRLFSPNSLPLHPPPHTAQTSDQTSTQPPSSNSEASASTTPLPPLPQYTQPTFPYTTVLTPQPALDDIYHLTKDTVYTLLGQITDMHHNRTIQTNKHPLRNRYNWEELMYSAMFSNLSPSVLRSTLQRFKYAYGSSVDVSGMMHMVDEMDRHLAPPQMTMQSSLFGNEAHYEDLSLKLSTRVEDMLFKNEPESMMVTRPSDLANQYPQVSLVNDIYALQSNQMTFDLIQQYILEKQELKKQAQVLEQQLNERRQRGETRADDLETGNQ
ncbi:hypothetical protein DM01DRAFT_1340261 [Hesseltinella vesiculosa]|uniref:Uncharacterized protein n=1 Tax=Hesseltinella vesiculosa TaxID=101127 RepID=A0A1X2G4R2_9FUNG|nr:hypothetical protein DM01DRAFT_1340261 [Hesseltinella vesiculosa]